MNYYDKNNDLEMMLMSGYGNDDDDDDGDDVSTHSNCSK